MMDLHPGLMIWTVISFLAFLFFLTKFAWNPILKALDAREKGIKDDIAAAKNSRESAEKMMVEYQEKLKNAHSEAMTLVANARADADRIREKELAKTKEDANQMIEKARKQIELESQAAINQIRTEIAGLVISSTEKVIGKALSEKDQLRLINESLESTN